LFINRDDVKGFKVNSGKGKKAQSPKLKGKRIKGKRQKPVCGWKSVAGKKTCSIVKIKRNII
jgi:hypothetical protein